MRTELVSPLLAMPLFWLSLYNNLVSVSGQCLEDQRSLLLQLKNNLTFAFESSTKLKSWSPTNDCCSWIGVSCDKEGHVTALDLSEESVTGALGNSSSLFSLQHLQTLNLAYNNFTSFIPSAFKRMEILTSLNLSCAGFLGQIPIEISQMTRLVTLDLSSTTWFLPCEWNNELKLENPNLRKLVQNLTSIRQLYLDGVSISAAGHEWSSALVSLRDLQETSMSQCNLSGPLDPSLASLENLSVIVLDENGLSSAVPETFADFKFLTILSLSRCQLTGTFPQKIFNMVTLVVVDVTWNHHLQGFFPDFPLGSLQTLMVSGTKFSGAFPRSIGNMRNLSHLDFSYCQFNGTIPNSLSNLTELRYLYLSDNNFTGQIPSFNMAKSLSYLDLSYNGLSGSIPSSHFEGLNNLVTIYLDHNSISGSIPSSLFTLPQLGNIDLSNNQFGQLDEFTNVSSSQLYSLDLRSNNLKFAFCNLKTFPGFLSNHSNIEYLYLSDNYIHGIVPNWIWKLENLWMLNISHNMLTHLEGPLQNLSTRFSYLDLHHNKLEGPIPSFPENLEYLDFSSNKLNSVIPRNIGNYLTFTSFISLSNNALSGSIPDSFCNVSHLQVLDLSNNNIDGKIPLCLLEASTEILNLRQNSLMGPLPDIFSATCTLEILDLRDNKLDGKIPKSLSNCTWLEILNLGENKIVDVFPCMLMKISTLRVLVLREII